MWTTARAILDRYSKKTKILYTTVFIYIVLFIAYIFVADQQSKNAIWQRLIPDFQHPISDKSIHGLGYGGSVISSISPIYTDTRRGDPSDPECGYLVRKPPDGRLGSQMFAYASFFGMAKKQQPYANKTAFIRIYGQPSYLDAYFENLSIPYRVIPDTWFSKRKVISIDEPSCCRYHNGFVNNLACDGRHVQLNGFGCSFMYFVENFEEIKTEFKFKEHFRGNAYKVLNDGLKLKNLYRNNCTTVAVHLRRGDFLVEHIVNYGHTPATVDYLQRSVQYFEQKILTNSRINPKSNCLAFLIFGNDHDWNFKASEQVKLLKPNNTHFVLIDPKNSDPGADMMAMSICDHIAISTGTFGWWAAFLNRGLVTYQKEFARPKSTHYAEYDLKEYFLPHWVPL